MSAVSSAPEASQLESSNRPLKWLVLILVALLLWVLRPLLGGLLLAGLAVLVGFGPYERLVAALHGRRQRAALIATSVITLAVLLPLGLCAYVAVTEATEEIRSLAHTFANDGAAAAFTAKLPALLRDRLPSLDEAVDGALSLARRAAAAAPQFVASTTWLLTEALLTVVTIYYLFVEGRSLVALLKQVSPLRREQTDAMLAEFRAVALALFHGNMVTGLGQGLIAGIGFAIFGVPRALLLGVVTVVASFIPIVGTALVWVPVVAALALSHQPVRAIGLLVWSVVLVGLADNLIRPLVSQGRMALPRLLLFLTLFGGLQMFGPKGLLLGPLLGSLAVTALRLLARQSTTSVRAGD
jgi:predicted PurR-regulated permease PerM